jgi:tetratricopeptide (TPR) repeat protein
MEWAMENNRLEEAADVAVAYTWYWAINGLAAEGMRWLETVLGHIDGESDEKALDARRHASVLRSIGLLANPMGRVREARDHCTRAIELSRSCSDEVGTTAALLTLGIAEWALGDLNAAAVAHDEALSLAARTGERWHRLSALTLRARTALDADEPHVEELLEAAIAAAQDDNEHQMLSISLSLLGRHHLSAGRTPTARIAAERALAAARTINYGEGELSALNLLGRVHLSGGSHDRARDCFTKALSIAADANHRGALCETLESLALAAGAAGQHEHAYLLLQVSKRERARLGLHLPSFAASAVDETQATSSRVLGEAADLVKARVTFLRLDDLVDQLMPTRARHLDGDAEDLRQRSSTRARG